MWTIGNSSTDNDEDAVIYLVDRQEVKILTDPVIDVDSGDQKG